MDHDELDFSLPSDDENSEAEGDSDYDGQLENDDYSDEDNLVENIPFQLDNDDYSDETQKIPECDPFQLENDDYSEDPLSIPVKDNNLVWSSDTTIFEQLKLSLDEKPIVNASGTEIDFFHTIFDDDMVDQIVRETNKYAVQKISKNWSETTKEEIKAFIGMLIFMGIHVLPSIDHYWSSDPALRVDCVAQVMPIKRFKKIIENIHFNDNLTALPRSNPAHDKLHKVRPIIDMLNINIANKSKYIPSSYVAVDESMIIFKGRSAIKQFMPNKPIKWGYKVWCIADSSTGFVFKFEVYTGKSDCPGETLGEKVVINLTTDVRQGSLVIFDNFFSSVTLLERLHEKKLFACGTVRTTRKYLPDFMKPIPKTKNQKLKKPKPKPMKRGEYEFQTKGPIAATKWMDNKPVCMLSSAHNPKETSSVQRKSKDGSKKSIPCPKVVDVYNKKMGGVDRFDQLRERYEIGRRSVKWWHRIMYFLIDMAFVNGFIMWKNGQNTKQNEKQDQLGYRLCLARQLINGFNSRKRRGRPINFENRKKSIPDEVRFVQVGRHMPRKVSENRRCKSCCTKKYEKRTRFICTYCQVPLCPEKCFEQFHTK